MIHRFLDTLRQFGPADAVISRQTRQSYEQLVGSVTRWRDRLDRFGVTPGQVVALESAYLPHACAALFALVERKAIVVPLTALALARLAEARDIAQVEVVVALNTHTGEAHHVRTGRTAHHGLYDRLRHAESPGLVLFSSGTSGRSKASVLDFNKVLARYGEPTRARRTLSFLHLDHIGGINTLLHTLSQGGAIVAVPERSPDAVFATIAEHRVQVLPTTPTFLNMVLISGAHERHDTESLELITYGTEPMPLHTLRRIKAVLPHVRLKQTYGLSELGILPTRSRSDDTLWINLGGAGFECKIVDGVLWIGSEMAMLGYLNAPAPFDDEGFFNTQDMVETDGDYVRILGRRSEIINVGGEKVYPSEVENVLLEMPNIAEATVSGKVSHVTGMVVKATVQLHSAEDEDALCRRVREYCSSRLDAFKVPMLVEVSSAPQHSERMKKLRAAP